MHRILTYKRKIFESIKQIIFNLSFAQSGLLIFVGGRIGTIKLTEKERFQANIILLCLLLFVTSFVSIIFYKYYTKGTSNKKKLQKLYPNDSFWNNEKIVNYAKNYYIEYYKHWCNNDLTPIKDSMKKNCFSFSQKILSRYNRNGIKHLITDVSINRISIISIKDYIDDSKDQVSVLIEGNCKDYFYPKKTDSTKEKFKDVFIFIREENKLVLCDINYDPDYSEIAFEKNFIEKTN